MTLNHYTTLGHSGLRVSRLALGTMTFGTDWGWGADKDTARGMFNSYVDAGGNLIDTADVYLNGGSEQWVGEFVKARGLRDQLVIATKFGFNPNPDNPNSGGNSRKNILRAVDASLKRLATDYIDLYLLHCWDQVTPVEEVMRTLDTLVRSGKVRHIGLSNVPAWYASRAQSFAEFHGRELLCTLQLSYSLVERSIENEFTALATRYGMSTMVWSPLGGGILSGKYKPSKEGKHGDGRLQVMSNPAFAKLSERNFTIVAELEKVARALGRSMSQVAVNWVAHRPGVATVLLGATKQAQLDDNLQALDFSIPAELLARLDAVSAVEASYPYTYFTPALQNQVAGNHSLQDKHAGYAPPIVIPGANAATGSE
jgi:aryl-alcohol dehydrogenase-like predicted oxidoreductase